VPVRLRGDLPDAFGLWLPGPREIQLDATAGNATQLQTLAHEMGHVALWDAGTTDILTSQQEEAVCNAMGSYLAAAIREGWIKLTTPPKKT
jgi:hypothetical protein